MAVRASGKPVVVPPSSTTPEVKREPVSEPGVLAKTLETLTQLVPVWRAAQPVRTKPAVPGVASFTAAMASDVSHDGWLLGAGGKLYPPQTFSADVPGLMPVDGRPIRERVMWVNGIMTPTPLHQQDMQALANTGREVVGVRNATRGMFRDLSQCILDKLDLGQNPAVDTTKRAILDAIKANQPLHLIGHSQGALILSRALFEVRNSLMLEGGMNAATAEATLSNIKVTTLGGAAARWPDGPRYTHWVNAYDTVPVSSGVAAPLSQPGKGAVIRQFKELNAPSHMPDTTDGLVNYLARFVDRTSHGPQDVYLKHLIADDRP